MKHNKKVNPLTHFNNLKGEAIKKGNQQLANYKKSLKKFQGDVTGSQVVSDAAIDSAKIDMSNKAYNTQLANARKLMDEAYKKADLEERNKQAVKALNNSVVPTPGSNIPSSTKPSIQGAYDEYKAFQMSKSKKGGSVKKMQMGGKVGVPKKSFTSDDRVNADGSKPKPMAPVSKPKPVNADKRPTVTKSSSSRVINNTSSRKASSVTGKTIIKEKDGSVSINKKNTGAINKAHGAGKTVYIPRNKYGGSTKKRK